MDPNVDYANALSWDDEMPARLAWLQENAPVYWAEQSDCFVLTRYEDVVAVSKNQELFTSGFGVRPGKNAPKIGLIDEPEPRHSQLRRLINKGFTPRMVKLWEEDFRQITKEALDAISGAGECEFVEEVAAPLPILLIAEMIGIPTDRRQEFHQWSDAMIAGDGNQDKPEVMAKAGAAFLAYSTLVKEIAEDRRKNPQEDLVSILVNADDEGILGRFEHGNRRIEGLDSEEHLANAANELVMLSVILMVAGNETTRNGLSGGMKLLIEHPDARQRLIDDPSLVPGAMEELLRLTSPVVSFIRTATQDTELRGVPIKKGQRVLMLYPSANRDSAQFDRPDELDLERNPQHLAFGIGNHFCLGANLARMELRVAFDELLRRTPDMRYSSGGPKMAPSALVRSFEHMDVEFTPESRAATA